MIMNKLKSGDRKNNNNKERMSSTLESRPQSNVSKFTPEKVNNIFQPVY